MTATGIRVNVTTGQQETFTITTDEMSWQPSAEERVVEQMVILRLERDRLLAETDWWCLSDRTPTQAQLDYRQALRDLPANYSSLETAVFPDKP